MRKIWQDEAWEDYLYWQRTDRNILKRCIGKPEPLKYDLSGFWSVRIDEDNRIVFRIRDGALEIWQCGSHYRDK